MSDSVQDAWAALRGLLEARGRALSDEVRRYPTPIARCDEQLPKLIEDRDAVLRWSRTAADLEQGLPTLARDQWIAGLRRFAAEVVTTDDEGLAAACRRLVAALGA